MDTISHGFAGSILARTLAERPGARAALILGAAAAVVPDLDFLMISNRVEYLRDHRSWTHSFFILPFLALALALVTKAFFRRAKLATLWLFAAIGIASHIVFDWATSFGTMFFTPLSRARYSLDWLFILDPFFTGITLGTLVLILVFRKRDRGRQIALAGSGVLGGLRRNLRRAPRPRARGLAAARSAAGGRDGCRAAAVSVAVPLGRPDGDGLRGPPGFLRHRALRARHR